MMRRQALLIALLAASGCERSAVLALQPLPPVSDTVGVAAPRVSGRVGTTDATTAPQVLYGRGPSVTAPSDSPAAAGGDISVDFVDTDIREVVAQVLGTLLGVNYTIDPAVRGTATLRTVNPVSRSQLLPALQAVLGQNGAALVQSGGLYRVVPAAAAAASGALAGNDAVSGGAVIPLRYASAEDLARVLQPFVGSSGRIVADPSRNVLLVSGDPATRETLVSLVRSFDINALAGQSYALFPVPTGSARDFAAGHRQLVWTLSSRGVQRWLAP